MLQRVTNSAAEKGLQRFSWWKDWRGQSVAIVASGPSAKNANVDLLKGRMPVLAIKEAHLRLAPWSDVVYGCEAPWWNKTRGLPEYKGLRLAWLDAPIQFPGVERFRIDLRKARGEPVDRLVLDEPGLIGGGGSSGFQALNIALQFGAARILLIGFDMNCGSHFYGRNNWPKANNPDEMVLVRWRKAMDIAATDLQRRGIEVVNASRESALAAFPKMGTQEAIEAWRL